MLLALKVLLLFSLTKLSVANGKVPTFVEIRNRLHREPPVTGIQKRASIVTDYIEQKIDNFDDSNIKTYRMRYMENREFWVPGGPIFIYLGGEWTISASMISKGHLYDMAKENEAMLYYTEHRFYGDSRPTSDITRENLKYLDVKQALADVANFIKTKKSTVAGMENSKVIVVGGSYSATMVIWLKHLYPDLIDGGWASSAPLNAKVDFYEYMEIVGRSYRELGSDKCYSHIEKGVATFEEMFAQNRGAEVKAMLRVCSNFDETNDLDLWTLFSSISGVFASVAQYQTGNTIKMDCEYMLQFEDPAVALAHYVLRSYLSEECLDFTFQDTLDYYMETTYKYGASRPWFYQTCNEYGWYQSSSSKKHPFGTKFPPTLEVTLCENIFGSQYTNSFIMANAAQTNADFLGYEIEVENIYETHGALDPWHPMGHGPEKNATLLPKTSHCADFSSISSSDSIEMRSSKEKIADLVRQWLQD